MSTNIVACLLLYRHRQVRFTFFVFVCFFLRLLSYTKVIQMSNTSAWLYQIMLVVHPLPPIPWMVSCCPLLALTSECLTVTHWLSSASGSSAVEAGGGLFQHEGGDSVTWLWPGFLGELRGRGDACSAPPRELCQRDQQRESQRGVHYRPQPYCTSALWAQLLQQWPFPRLHFWCNHRYVTLLSYQWILPVFFSLIWWQQKE